MNLSKTSKRILTTAAVITGLGLGTYGVVRIFSTPTSPHYRQLQKLQNEKTAFEQAYASLEKLEKSGSVIKMPDGKTLQIMRIDGAIKAEQDSVSLFENSAAGAQRQAGFANGFASLAAGIVILIGTLAANGGITGSLEDNGDV